MIATYPSELYESDYDDFRSYPLARKPRINRGIAPRNRTRKRFIRPKAPVQILIPKRKAIAFGEPRKTPVKQKATAKVAFKEKKKVDQRKKQSAISKAKALKQEIKQKEVEEKKMAARDKTSKTSKVLLISLTITTLSLIGYVIWQRQKINKL